MRVSRRGCDILTDTGYHNYVTVLSFPHNGKYSFDDVHVGEEVDLEDFVDQAYRSTTLRKFFNGADNSCKLHRSVEAMRK